MLPHQQYFNLMPRYKDRLMKLRYFIYIPALILFSCNNLQSPSSSSGNPGSTQPPAASIQGDKKEICWTGTFNGRFPVFIHYQLQSNVIVGEITYLNTKEKLPTRLLGTVEEDKHYRLLEF